MMHTSVNSRTARARVLERQAIKEAKTFLKSAKRAPLVNIASIPSVYENTGKSHRKTVQKYRLLAHARKLLTDANVMTKRGKKHRTRTCSKFRSRGAEGVTVKLNANDLQSEAAIGNVQTCTCLWGCPICYEAKAIEAGEKILKAIHWAEENNHFCIMVGLTAKHSREMPLAYSKGTFKDAWDTFNAHYSWKKFKKSYVSHVIHNVDITHGDVNGWHYHKHLLLFFDKDKVSPSDAREKADGLITKYWLRSLDLNGGEASAEHGAHVSDEKKAPSEYMAKIGITVQDGKLNYEMTSSTTKDSRTVFDLLRHARLGDNQAVYLFLEYVKTMTGDNWMSFGRSGLQKIIENTELPVNDESAKKPKKAKRNWLIFSDYWWDIVRWSDGQARIVEVAAKTRSLDAVKELLLAMRLELAQEQKLSEYFLKWIPETNSMADIRVHEDWLNENLPSGSLQ